MRLSPLLLFLPLAAVASAQDRGPGVPGQPRDGGLAYPITGFDGVGLGTGATVAVHAGPGFAVRATGPAAALANLRVTRDGDTLSIQRRYNDRHDDQLERQVRFSVTMPRIDSASVGGSGRIAVDRATGPSFEGAVGGSGTLVLGALDVERMSASIGGSGSIAASGTARALEVNIGGSGSFDGTRMTARRASVSVAGSGGVRANVDGRASVTIAGSGDVDLGRSARCSVTRIGSGHARCA